MDRPTNRLADETSSYLRQHMHNPVDWYPWGDEALSRARELDRPLLVSIGYSACHWCHVMERESFENAATAALMNEGFVNVKVDREERPDVDQIYMDTVVRLTGHGGWPLTVFCTPDGRPFYGGTYFPPEPRHGLLAFPDLLNRIRALYRGERAKIEESAGQILSALRARPQGVASELPGPHALLGAARELMQAADEQNGGFGRPGPKFPTPTNLQLVLAALPDMDDDEAARTRSFLTFSCAQMARRGLYDPLGGGFHRYCVDEHWGVPHFEKMLYDQAQLIGVYADLFRQGGCQDENLVWPIRETAAYLRREMRGPEGGYYASQDADSEGVEGRFYVWTPAQVEAVLGGQRAEAFCAAYGVTERGNFEGSTVLWDLERGPRAHLAAEREALYQARCERAWPATDKKRLASWNGLAISGLAHAGSVLGDAELLADARAALDFVETHLIDGDGHLLRVFDAGVARVPGFLDDHAAVLAAALDLYRAAGAPADLALALRLAETISERFFDANEGDLFLTPNDGERLPHRPRSDHDGALPNSTGLAVIGLLRVAALTGNHDLRRIAEAVIRGHAFELERAALGFPTLLRAAAWGARELGTAVIIGPDTPAAHALAHEARVLLAPEEAVVVLAPGSSPGLLDESLLRGRDPKDGQAAAYLCRGTRCSLPVTTAGALASLL